MAADGLMIADHVIKSTSEKKIWVVRNRNSLIATCGAVADGEKFLEWAERSKPDERHAVDDLKVDDSFCAIEARSNGEIWIWDTALFAYPIQQEFHAIGSGWEIAWGALGMGASAEEAVLVACKHSCYSGGDIQIESIAQQYGQRAA